MKTLISSGSETCLNSRRSALAASLAFASLADALSQTSRTIDQSSDAVAVRYPSGRSVSIGHIGCRKQFTNHTCQLGSAEIVFTPILVAGAFESFSVPILFLFCLPPLPFPVPQHTVPEPLFFVLLYPDGLVVGVMVFGWIWRLRYRGKILMWIQGLEYSQGCDTARDGG